MKSTLCACVGLALLCASLINVSAIPVAPGLSFVPAAGEPDPVGASLVYSTGPVAWSSATISGTLTSRVLSGDLSNPLGGLTFTYEILVTGFAPHGVSALSVGGYADFFTDMGFQVPPTGLIPTFMERSLEAPGFGNDVTFRFLTPEIPVGSASALMVVQTDALGWTFNIASIINSSAAENIRTVAPSRSVPEQSNVGIFFLGLASLGLVGAFFRKTEKAATV